MKTNQISRNQLVLTIMTFLIGCSSAPKRERFDTLIVNPNCNAEISFREDGTISNLTLAGDGCAKAQIVKSCEVPAYTIADEGKSLHFVQPTRVGYEMNSVGGGP